MKKKKKTLPKYQVAGKNKLQNKVFVPSDTFATNAQEDKLLSQQGKPTFMDNQGNEVEDLEEMDEQSSYDKTRGFFSNLEEKAGLNNIKISPLFEALNTVAYGVTGVANTINNQKANQQEQKDYREALMPTAWENMERYSLNTNPIFTKFGGKSSKYQTGGAAPIDPQVEELQKKYNIRQTTPDQRRDWNQFSAYAKSKGFTKGSTELDTGTGGDELFNSYVKENPKTTLTRDIVPSVQFEMLQLKNTAQGLARRQGLPQAESVMNWASGVDNKIGDQTVYSTYPDAEYREYTGGQLTSQQYLGLTDANLTPEMKAQRSAQVQGQQPGQPKLLTVSGKPVPAGVKVERGADGSYYYENRDGDLIQLQQQKQTGGKFQYGGGSMKTKFSVKPKHADVEAEKGEVVEGTGGDISIVNPNGNTHEEGGEFIPDVQRVLENTSDLRNDKTSRYLQLQPFEVKALTGIDVKKPMSHAKALIEANKVYDNQRTKIINKINIASKDRKDLDKYGEASTKLNLDHFSFIPKDEQIFDKLFAHQEIIKQGEGIADDGSKAKYGIKMQAGGDKPEGFSRLSRNWDKEKRAQYVFDQQDGKFYHKDDYQKVLSARSETGDITAYTGDKSFKGNKSMYSDQEWRDFAKKIGYTGKTNKGLQEYIYSNPKLKPIIDELHSKYGEPQGGTKFDSRLGYRWDKVKDAIENYKWDDSSLTPEEKLQNKGSNPDPSIQNNVDITGQKGSQFNEPLRWYDIASPVNALLSSLDRLPEKYNPTEVNQLRLKLQDPTTALQANQADYNAAVSAVQSVDPANAGAAAANIQALAARKYSLNNQVVGNFENQNAQIKNQEIIYNTQARDRQGLEDQKAREVFEDKVLTSKALQQEQKLTATDALYKTIAENRALNRNGNLIMKFARAFDQYGEKNDYQTKFQVNPALGVPAPAKGKVDPAGGIQNLTPGKSYYNRKTGKVLRFDGVNLIPQ